MHNTLHTRMHAHMRTHAHTQAGVPCKLLTGEEIRPCPYAQHTSCTVEMAPVAVGYQAGKVYDTAVLDEIQVCTLVL